MGKSREIELANWFERHQRILPWRSDPSLYRVWISEIMLQQTQVATVIPYFERFIGRFPSVEILAKSSEQEVLRHWAGLGYYSRARNVLRTAERIVAEGFPRTREGWEDMPGVGPYTAGAILSIALDQCEAILDGNVERVLSRVFLEVTKAGLWVKSAQWVRAASGAGVRPSVTNQALMELGAKICVPREPRCPSCPLKRGCQAFALGVQMEFPPKKERVKWIRKKEARVFLASGGRFLVERAGKGQWREGLWDLPVEAPLKGVCVGEVETRHVVTRHKIVRTTQVVRVSRARKLKNPRFQWVEGDELPLGSAAQKSVKAAQALLANPPKSRKQDG